MKRFGILGIALVAVLALGVFTASASATFLLAEWLVGGSALSTELVGEISGELLLEDTKAVLGSPAAVLCSGITDGWIGPNSLGWVSEVLSLNGEAISTTPLSGLALECEPQSGCETNTLPLVWPIGLPAETEVELLEQGTEIFFAVLGRPHSGGVGGWEITNCLVLGTAHEDECTASEGAAELKLEGTTLLGAITTAFTELAGLKLALCTASGAETGLVEGSAPILLSGGGELAASSESSVS